MTQKSSPLFLYLDKKNIIIDKSEFEFQIQSHPDYPTLLAVADTLHFFDVDTLVARVSFDDLENLPTQFIAHLTTESIHGQLYFIEKKGNLFFYTSDKKLTEISEQELKERWTEIILLVEKQENELSRKSTQNLWFRFLQIATLALLVLQLFLLKITIENKFFLVFPTLGIFLSVAALKDLFGTKSELLNNFCNLTASTSCNSVVNSIKWKIFKIINFSDLSMVFFSAQFLALLMYLFLGDTTAYFFIQKLMLLAVVPLLFSSIYYQKFVEKKWCPICLAVIGIIVLEIGYVTLFVQSAIVVSLKSILVFSLLFLFISMVWSYLKKILTEQKKLKEFSIKSAKFMRNYEVFKNILMTSDKTIYQPLYSGNLLLGNENASLKITIVSNPFCNHCGEIHNIIEEILDKHDEKVCVDFRFNYDARQKKKHAEIVHNKLLRIYYDNGQKAFLKAFHDWFENQDETQLTVSENTIVSDKTISEILQEQYLMNQANEISFTPAIIINQYQFPKFYDRKDLLHFINDLVEDTFE